MRKIVTPEQMRAIDQYMIHHLQIPGIVLMENAAGGVTRKIIERFPNGKVLVFCGLGNNGGDGLAVARQLMALGCQVFVAVLGAPERFSGDAGTNYGFFDALDDCIARMEAVEDIDFFFSQHQDADVLVDAIFGIGLKRSPEGIFQYAIDKMNESGKWIVSVDIPSGVDGATGRVLETAVRANETVTFQYAKVDHYIYPGADYAGKLTVQTIGYDKGCPILDGINLFVSEQNDEKLVIGKKERNTNKGSFGRLLLICGSKGMAGAAVLCAKAALRMGNGLTTVASCGYVADVIQDSVPEAMAKVLGQSRNYMDADAAAHIGKILEKYSAVAIGPGIGQNLELMDFLIEAIEKDIPKVLDADALNILALNPTVLQNHKGETIITPHPGEMARLIQSSVKEVLDNPVETARNFAFRYGVVTVLKGASTVVAAPTGFALIIPQGSAGMAKGGSGDVLTGILGALLAQGYEGFAAATLGVYLNAVAGEIAEAKFGEYSMTAADTITCLKDAIEKQLRDIPRDWAKDQIEEIALIRDSLKNIAVSPHLSEFQSLSEFGKSE